MWIRTTRRREAVVTVASDNPPPRERGNGGLGQPLPVRFQHCPIEAAARDLASQAATNFLRNSPLVRIRRRTDVVRAQASNNVHPPSSTK